MARVCARLLCVGALALGPAPASGARADLPDLAYVHAGEVWTARADGSSARRLTETASARWAAWSADARFTWPTSGARACAPSRSPASCPPGDPRGRRTDAASPSSGRSRQA